MADVPARDRLDEQPEIFARAEMRWMSGRRYKALVEVARAARKVYELPGVYVPPGGQETWGTLRAALSKLDGPDKEQPNGCAACDGDPEAHGQHVCGREDFA